MERKKSESDTGTHSHQTHYLDLRKTYDADADGDGVLHLEWRTLARSLISQGGSSHYWQLELLPGPP
jgi:hypothetical protein